MNLNVSNISKRLFQVDRPRGVRAMNLNVGNLSKRLFQVAALAAQNKTNRQIAAELKISGYTVTAYMHEIYVELDLVSTPKPRMELAFAMREFARETP